MPGEDVENAAAHGELATRCHLRRFFISALQQSFAQGVTIQAVVAPQDERLFPERLSAWNQVLKRRLGQNDHRAFALSNFLQHLQTLRDDFRVGNRFLYCRRFDFREKQGLDLPV